MEDPGVYSPRRFASACNPHVFALHDVAEERGPLSDRAAARASQADPQWLQAGSPPLCPTFALGFGNPCASLSCLQPGGGATVEPATALARLHWQLAGRSQAGLCSASRTHRRGERRLVIIASKRPKIPASTPQAGEAEVLMAAPSNPSKAAVQADH